MFALWIYPVQHWIFWKRIVSSLLRCSYRVLKSSFPIQSTVHNDGPLVSVGRIWDVSHRWTIHFCSVPSFAIDYLSKTKLGTPQKWNVLILLYYYGVLIYSMTILILKGRWALGKKRIIYGPVFYFALLEHGKYLFTVYLPVINFTKTRHGIVLKNKLKVTLLNWLTNKWWVADTILSLSLPARYAF